MADRGEDNKLRRFIIVALVVELALVIFVAKPEWLNTLIARDQSMTQLILGAGSTAQIVARTKAFFDAAFVNTGIIANSYHLFSPGTAAGTSMPGPHFGTFHQHVTALWLFVYALVYRVFSYLIWLPYMLPFILAAALDGYMRRQVSKWRFEFTSPIAHRTATRIFGGALGVSMILVIAPFPVPPLAAPILIAMVSVALWTWIAHTQKRI